MSNEPASSSEQGPLRVAIAVGPAKSAVWTTRREGQARPEGVTVDLADALAARMGRPLKLVELGSSGQIVETANDGTWDVTFVPVDDERRKSLAIGPAYHMGESTYLVKASSAFVKASDVDSEGVRVLGVENTATLRSAKRAAGRADVGGRASLTNALAEFEAGDCDALALGKDSLRSILERMPGTRMTEGNFHAAETAVAVPKGLVETLGPIADLMNRMKQDGTVRRILDRHGMSDAAIPS